jgi:hypothetical protein
MTSGNTPRINDATSIPLMMKENKVEISCRRWELFDVVSIVIFAFKAYLSRWARIRLVRLASVIDSSWLVRDMAPSLTTDWVTEAAAGFGARTVQRESARARRRVLRPKDSCGRDGLLTTSSA